MFVRLSVRRFEVMVGLAWGGGCMCRLVVSNELTLTLLGPAGADPGFPVGGGVNPPGGANI